MVVPGELLGELVARDLVGRDQAVDHAALFQHGQIAVQGALGLGCLPLLELGDAQGPPGRQQQLHELAPAAGVALAGTAQLLLDGGVEIR